MALSETLTMTSPVKLGSTNVAILFGTGDPDGDASPEIDALKGSLYIRTNETKDLSPFRAKVDEASADEDWVRVPVDKDEGAYTMEGAWTWSVDAKVLFRDAAIYIYSNADGYLKLVADTNVIINGDGTNEWEFDASGNCTLTGTGRLDLSAATVTAGNTDGGVIKCGTSAARVTEDTADMKFLSFYFDNGATSGDNRGIYNRLYLSGAGGGGESLRSYTTVEDVAAGTAHGAHLSLDFGASGSITGLGVASRNTLHIPDAALAAGGTYAATMVEIFSDGASSDPGAVSELSFLRLVNDGNADGIADVDDDAFLFTLAGGSLGAGNVMAAKTAAAVSHTLRVKIHNITYYLMVSDAQ